MQATKEEAYNAGANCGEFGCNTENSHFSYFATKELCREWERGRSEYLYGCQKPATKRSAVRMATDFHGDLYVAE